MNIINYENVNKTNVLNNAVVEKLIFNNFNYYINNNIKYFLLVIPILNIKNEDYINNVYTNYIKKINLLNITLPGLKLDKIVITIDNNNNSFIIKNNKFNLNNNYKDILNHLINFTIDIQKLLGILNNISLKIQNKLTIANYYNIKYFITYIDNLLLYIYHIHNFINQINNISLLFSEKNELNMFLKKNIIKLENEELILKDNLFNTRQSLFQKITYIETTLSRLLTNIATIFLPLSFIITVLSLPSLVKNVKQYNFQYLFIIITVIIIIIYIIQKYFKKYINNKIITML